MTTQDLDHSEEKAKLPLTHELISEIRQLREIAHELAEMLRATGGTDSRIHLKYPKLIERAGKLGL